MRRRAFLAFAAGAALGIAGTQCRRELWSLVPDWPLGPKPVPVLDLHFQTMRGTGWLPQEQPNWDQVVSTAIERGPTRGQPTDLTVSETAGFYPGQLVCFQIAEGEYQSATISEIDGKALRLRQAVDTEVSPDTPLYNFLSNDSHPTEFGYYTLVDDALRQLSERPLSIDSASGIAAWDKIGECRFSENHTSEYDNPGTDGPDDYSLQVEVERTTDGIISREFNLGIGAYRVTLPIAVQGATERGAHLRIAATRNGKKLAHDDFLTYDGVAPIYLDFKVRVPGPVRVSLTLSIGGALRLSVGKLEMQRRQAYKLRIRKGRHVLLGDSWINSGYVAKRFRERLTDAEFIQAGVGGNTVEDLLARFDADVAPHKPDFVWVLCGTNDVFEMLTPEEFQPQVIALREKIRAIGAQPIFWNPSVCNRFYTKGDRLAPSRRLAMNVDYNAPGST